MPRSDSVIGRAGIHSLDSLAREPMLPLLEKRWGSVPHRHVLYDAPLTVPTPQLELSTVGGQECILFDMESHL